MLPALMGWVALGLIAGFLANFIVFRKPEDRQLDVLIGVCGAVVGGLIHRMFGHGAEAAFGMWNILPALIGSLGSLSVWHVVKGTLLRA
jgi:uncharacterized membrane protein YeaQ/YmgE (transglycosylase-associated protein family)